MDERRWILLVRYDDGLEAELVCSFLREHGVAVRVQGNSGASAILNRFDTVIDIRLFVPEDELERARETLAAMTAGADAVVPEPPVSDDPTRAGSPYRMGNVRPHELSPEDGPAPANKPRYRRAAFVLAFALPIGSAHFYARHHVAGAVLGIGIGAFFLAGAVRGDFALVTAALALVVFDAFAGLVAVKRWNDGRVFTPRQQVGIAAVGIVAAMGTGLVLRAAHLEPEPAGKTIRRAGVSRALAP
jgi:hypothetical protein